MSTLSTRTPNRPKPIKQSKASRPGRPRPSRAQDPARHPTRPTSQLPLKRPRPRGRKPSTFASASRRSSGRMATSRTRRPPRERRRTPRSRRAHRSSPRQLRRRRSCRISLSGRLRVLLPRFPSKPPRLSRRRWRVRRLPARQKMSRSRTRARKQSSHQRLWQQDRFGRVPQLLSPTK